MADDDVRVALLGDVTVGTTQDANFQAALGGNRLALWSATASSSPASAASSRASRCGTSRRRAGPSTSARRGQGLEQARRRRGRAARGAADLGGPVGPSPAPAVTSSPLASARSCAATPSRRATRCGSSIPSTAAGPSSTARAAPTARVAAAAAAAAASSSASRPAPAPLPGGALAVAFDAAAGRCAVATESGLASSRPTASSSLPAPDFEAARRGARAVAWLDAGHVFVGYRDAAGGDDALARAAVHAVAAGAAAPFAEDEVVAFFDREAPGAPTASTSPPTATRWPSSPAT
ncbi:hypothetical protein JL720_15664 [Aureococcus anophagefferens]|nr:hypothetical protein JL720_15664 [Aureococcus anophagefferens]